MVLPNSKNPYQKKLRWSKKGEGGLSLLTKSKKKQVFFMPPLRNSNQSEMQRAKSGLFGWGGERMETVSGMDCKVSSSFQHSTVEICVCQGFRSQQC